MMVIEGKFLAGLTLRISLFEILHHLLTWNEPATTSPAGGGQIAQWLASLSVERAVQVRARHDPLVSERWNSIRVLLKCSHQC